MLINIQGRWINPHNMVAVIPAGEGAAKVVFNGGYELEFAGAVAIDLATEINNLLAAQKKERGDRPGGRSGGFKRDGDRGGFKREGGFKRDGDRGDRGGYKGDRDRGDRGGDRGGYKKKFDRDDKPAYNSDERKERVREDFGDRKSGGKKFESKERKEFKPKKRKEW